MALQKISKHVVQDNTLTGDQISNTLNVDTIEPQSGTSLTIGASGDTITVPTGATLTVPNGGLSGQNYPAWIVTMTSNQSLTAATNTVLNFDNEAVDTDSAYDTTNKKFVVPSGQAGKYFVSLNVRIGAGSSVTTASSRYIYKNGTGIIFSGQYIPSNPMEHATLTTAGVLDLAVGDEIQAYGRFESTSGNGFAYENFSNFSGFRIGD